jgi:molybdopterin-binding protein
LEGQTHAVDDPEHEPLFAVSGRMVQPWPVSEGAHGPIADDRNSRPETTMKISARNQLKGKIVAVKPGATTSHVSIDVGQGSILTASTTNEAVADLGLKVGENAWAIIKASDVLVAK